MLAIPSPRPIQGLPPTERTWTYQRLGLVHATDIGVVQGCQVALPIHFHDEDQVVFVLAGQRRIVVGDSLLCLGPGQFACIPALTPHRSLSERADVLCMNAYLVPGTYQADLLHQVLTAWWQGSNPGWSGLVAAVESQSAETSTPGTPDLSDWMGPHGGRSVQHSAALAGMSREGYSRKFQRLHGVSPETHRLLSRANAARRVLRQGMPVAQVAAATGFADQSHLGRVFRRLFGVTPGVYRMGRGSHTF